jgi:5-methylcytosine-specific restriction endonuclease McrA
MARRNFTKAIIVARIKASTKDGVVYCDLCSLPCRKWEVDHIRADGLLGEPTFDNSRLLCVPCHKEKTLSDVKAISKAKRVEARHLGAAQPKKKIQSRGFQKKEPKEKIPFPPRRMMFEDQGTEK